MEKKKAKENTIAATIKYLAIVGIVISILGALVAIGGELEIIEDSPYLVGISIISFIFMYGFGEIIDLLQKIVNNTSGLK